MQAGHAPALGTGQAGQFDDEIAQCLACDDKPLDADVRLSGGALMLRSHLLSLRLRVLLERDRGTVADLAERESQLARLNERLVEDSRHDPLTGMRNRRALSFDLPRIEAEHQEQGDSLALATHGRAFWILDDLAPVREWSPGIETSKAYLFAPQPANHTTFPTFVRGLRYFGGANQPDGAVIDYWLSPSFGTPTASLIASGACGRMSTVSTTSVSPSQWPIEWPWNVGSEMSGCRRPSV